MLIKKNILVFSLSLLLLSFTYVENNNNKHEIGLKIGNKAPDLILFSPDGDSIKLSDLKGKIVLVDFWASWCGPCRRENPYVVKAYKKFKNKSFEGGDEFTVFSVSLDRNKDRWLHAIKKDKLNWPYHGSDFKGWNSEAAIKYNIRGIPDNYLINGEGIIVAKQLRGKKLINTLDNLLKK